MKAFLWKIDREKEKMKALERKRERREKEIEGGEKDLEKMKE